MFTRTGGTITGVATTVIVLGVLLGNYLMILAGALPLLIGLGAALDKPARAGVTRHVSATRVQRGDTVDVELVIQVPKGAGIIEVHQPVPDPFLLKEGSNLHVLRLRHSTRTVRVAFRMVATKRGRWRFEPVSLRHRHALGFLEPVTEPAVMGRDVLEVTPRITVADAKETEPAPARHLMPAGDITRFGPPGTDFRDIRPYAWGDPPKTINWKASARRLSTSSNATPLVNEFEREGKKSIWIVLDAGPALEVGDDVDNALERAIEGTLAAANHFTNRGYRVGLLVANGGELPLLPPDTGGREQLRRIVRVLTRVTPGDNGGLVGAVSRARGHIRLGKPYVIVLGRLSTETPGAAEGLRALAGLTRGSRGRVHGLVIDVRPHGLEAKAVGDVDASSRDTVEALDRRVAQVARQSGFPSTSWDPAEEAFANVFRRATAGKRAQASRARRGKTREGEMDGAGPVHAPRVAVPPGGASG